MKKKSWLALLAIILVLITISVVISVDKIDEIKSQKTVNILHKNNTSFSEQWGLYNYGQSIKGKIGIKGIDINILKAWRVTKGSSDIIVGVLDSGIETDCKEIKNNIYINKKEIDNNSLDDDNNGYIDDVNGWDFYNNDKTVYDNYLHDYHGTYLSGIISATHDNGEVCGVAPNVKLLPLKFLQGTQGQTQDAIKAIEYAHKLGVKIINCSWDNTTYDEKLKNIMQKYSDILFVCSAGKNMDDLNKTPVYPACFDLPNIVSVTAIDNQGNLYTYAGYGEKAQVAAPGVDIYSTLPDGDFTYSSGTSMATAYVTGIAALVKSYNPQLSSTQIADILKHSAKPLKQLKNKVSSGGIIDAYLCLKKAHKY